jgi:hypothetical protein
LGSVADPSPHTNTTADPDPNADPSPHTNTTADADPNANAEPE